MGLCLPVLHAQVSGHPEMDEENSPVSKFWIWCEAEQKILASAPEPLDLRSSQAPTKLPDRQERDGSRAQDLDRTDCASHNPPRQRPANGFDFGQLRHGMRWSGFSLNQASGYILMQETGD